MGKKDPRVDAYIAEAEAFAKPILTHLRSLIHKADPEIEETIKWNFPFFLHNGMVCHFAGFKAHCVFGFWRWRSISKDNVAIAKVSDSAMGDYGRIAKLSDLPSDAVIVAAVKEAVRLNSSDTPPPRLPKRAPRPLVVPKILKDALAKKLKAKAVFEAFSMSHKREYAEWISEAKTEETRQRRLATTLELLVEGKSRNWKYKNC